MAEPHLYVAATGHIYAGLCPDSTQPDARDEKCPACQLLIAAARHGVSFPPWPFAIAPTNGVSVAITAEMVAQLSAETDQPKMLCKRALTECSGDMAKANEWLRLQGRNLAATPGVGGNDGKR